VCPFGLPLPVLAELMVLDVPVVPVVRDRDLLFRSSHVLLRCSRGTESSSLFLAIRQLKQSL
jgi:hypothetical protein